jgi:hypothetical protein
MRQVHIDGGVRLAIDFGTSNTVAVLAGGDGRIRPLVFDGSELLPSGVLVADGQVLVGRDAEHAARADPAGYEPHPKRCVDDDVVLLGGVELPVGELFTAILRRVGDEARRVAGGPPASVVLTCPAGWGRRRRALLERAASAAGLQRVTLVPEPVAAAWFFVDVAGASVPVGGSVLIYDFGAGTFDASVIRRTAAGFEVLAEEGLRDTGGLDVDAAIVAHLGTRYVSRDPDLWARLSAPREPQDLRASRLLWQDVRAGKEMLSRTSSTLIHVPLFDDTGTPLGRDQFELLVRPVLDRTVAASRAALREAEVAAGDLAGLFLVGGASRIPLAATLLHRAFGLAPTVIERPELVVAEGALHAPRQQHHPAPQPPEPEPEAMPEPEPLPEPKPLPEPEPTKTAPVAAPPPAAARPVLAPLAAPRPSWSAPDPPSRRPMIVGVVVLLVVALIIIVAVQTSGNGTPSQSGAAPSSGAASPSPSASPVTFQALSTTVSALTFNDKGDVLAGATTGGVEMWNPANGKSVGNLSGHGARVEDVAFAAGRYATSGHDDTVRLWDGGGKQAGQLSTPKNLTHVALAPDATMLAYGGYFGTRLWNVATDQPGKALSGTGAGLYVYSLAFSPDGRYLAAGLGHPDNAGEFWLWEVASGRKIDQVTGYGSFVNDVAFNSAGMLAIASADGKLELRDVSGNRTTLVAAAAGTATWAVAFSRDGKTLASSHRGGPLRLWDVTSGRMIKELSDHASNVYGLAFSPVEDLLASVDDRGKVVVRRIGV